MNADPSCVSHPFQVFRRSHLLIMYEVGQLILGGGPVGRIAAVLGKPSQNSSLLSNHRPAYRRNKARTRLAATRHIFAPKRNIPWSVSLFTPSSSQPHERLVIAGVCTAVIVRGLDPPPLRSRDSFPCSPHSVGTKTSSSPASLLHASLTLFQGVLCSQHWPDHSIRAIPVVASFA